MEERERTTHLLSAPFNRSKRKGKNVVGFFWNSIDKKKNTRYNKDIGQLEPDGKERRTKEDGGEQVQKLPWKAST